MVAPLGGGAGEGETTSLPETKWKQIQGILEEFDKYYFPELKGAEVLV